MTKKMATRNKAKSAPRKGAAIRKPSKSAKASSRKRKPAPAARPRPAGKPKAAKLQSGKPVAGRKPVPAKTAPAKTAPVKGALAKGAASRTGSAKGAPATLKGAVRPVAVPLPSGRAAGRAPDTRRRSGSAPGLSSAVPASPFDARSRGLGSAVQFARSVAARDSATLRPRDSGPPKPAPRVRPRPARAEGGVEPALDHEELRLIREALEGMRRELQATIQKTWRSGMEARDEAFSEMGDFVSASVEKEQIFETGQSGVEMLREVERALERAGSGTYGLCESCGGRIPNSRLKAIPHARFCLECQEAQERGKAI